VVLEYLLSLDLCLSKSLLEPSLHLFYLPLEIGHHLNLLAQKVGWEGGRTISSHHSVCLVCEVDDLLVLHLGVVDEAILFLHWQVDEALGEKIPLGLAVFSAVEFKLVHKVEPLLFELRRR
jgi:hypothetical protein